MMKRDEWTAINEHRAIIYQWFGSLFALEQTEEQLNAYKHSEFDDWYELFNELGLGAEISRFQEAMANLIQDDEAVLELSADFAQHFLLDDEVSVLPYASFYLENGRLYGDVETKMRGYLAENHLSVAKEYKEPADHLAVYLYLMAHWIERADDFADYVQISKEQVQFLQMGLLSWLPQFVEASQTLDLKYDVYPAVAQLLVKFIEVDVEYLQECSE